MPLIYPKLFQKKSPFLNLFFKKSRKLILVSVYQPKKVLFSSFMLLLVILTNCAPSSMRVCAEGWNIKFFPCSSCVCFGGKKGLEGKGEEGEEEEDAPPLPQWRSLGGAKFFSSFGKFCHSNRVLVQN